MKPVHIAFEQPDSSAWRRRLLGHGRGSLGIVAALALAASLAALALVSWQTSELESALGEARHALAAMQARPGKPPARAQPAVGPVAARERDAWNDLVRQLNTPWPTLLDTLEERASPDVALVAIEPDARSGNVRIQAEAKSLGALLDYANGLATAPGVKTVRLLRHETHEQDPARPLRLSIEARFGAARSER
ncbi:MAG: hypothetical protein HY854_25615 [Burkholderiales bacterium]|nr:hypothetical protein [Burkholderiales bacterium]